MIKLLMIAMVGFCFLSGEAQVPVKVQFYHHANGKALRLDSIYNSSEDRYNIQRLRYYVSNLTLLTANGTPTNARAPVFLIDAFEEDTASILLPSGSYTALRFLLGTDSLQNVSGATDGALDPLNNMYWTWNTGFINFKMEGEITREGKQTERMQYHIGGFSGPYKTMRQITLPFSEALVLKEGMPMRIQLLVDVAPFFNGLRAANNFKSPVIMNPGKQAAIAADQLTTMFSLQKEGQHY